jgi:hypothetical protein
LVGDDVTVSGFHLDWLNGRVQSDCSIRVDRVLRFVLSQNLITRSDIGIYTTRASGTIAGNFIRDGASGVAAKGGSRAHPSQYLIAGNRSVASASSGIVIEADGLGLQIDVGANQVALEPMPSSESREDPPMTTVATVVDNDCSDNSSAGLKCFLYAPPQKPINPLLSSGTVVPQLTVTASGNSFHRNGTYGLVVEGNNVFRSINYPLTGQFHGQFLNNSFADNTPAQALFTFSALNISLGDTESLKFIKYLQDATFDITDLDGELAGFDYDNPVTDPFDGTVLNNTLVVNGTVIPPGTKITP